MGKKIVRPPSGIIKKRPPKEYPPSGVIKKSRTLLRPIAQDRPKKDEYVNEGELICLRFINSIEFMDYICSKRPIDSTHSIDPKEFIEFIQINSKYHIDPEDLINSELFKEFIDHINIKYSIDFKNFMNSKDIIDPKSSNK